MGELGLGRNGEFVCVEIFVFVFWMEGGVLIVLNFRGASL